MHKSIYHSNVSWILKTGIRKRGNRETVLSYFRVFAKGRHRLLLITIIVWKSPYVKFTHNRESTRETASSHISLLLCLFWNTWFWTSLSRSRYSFKRIGYDKYVVMIILCRKNCISGGIDHHIPLKLNFRRAALCLWQSSSLFVWSLTRLVVFGIRVAFLLSLPKTPKLQNSQLTTVWRIHIPAPYHNLHFAKIPPV